MAAIDHEAAQAALREAHLAIVNAKWHICQEQALDRLSSCTGLACAPLFPDHPLIQIVACDGRLLGRARLHRTGSHVRWVATAATTTRQTGTYRTLPGAARALARAAGMPRRRRVTCLPGAVPGRTARGLHRE